MTATECGSPPENCSQATAILKSPEKKRGVYLTFAEKRKGNKMKTKLMWRLVITILGIFLAGCVNTQSRYRQKTTPEVPEKPQVASLESSTKQLMRGAKKGDVVQINNALSATPSIPVKDLTEALLVVVREMGRQKLTKESSGGGFSYKMRFENGSTILSGDEKIQVKNLTTEEIERFTETVRILLKAGADPNLLGFREFIRTQYDEGFLRAGPNQSMITVSVGNIGEIVPVKEAEEGVLNVATENGYTEVVELLKQYGAV